MNASHRLGIRRLVLFLPLLSPLSAMEPISWPPPPDSLLAEALADPGVRGHELLFVVRPLFGTYHAYETFGYYSTRPDRKVAHIGNTEMRTLDLRTGEQKTILRAHKPESDGAIRDPTVHYDGKTILFSYRSHGGQNFHLYEIDRDGQNLRQLTRGDGFDDIQPKYLPNDDIVFVSSRAQRYVPCYVSQVGNLFRVNREGSLIRRLTVHVDQDMVPFVLPDGRVGYTRWDYIDRTEGGTFGLWVIHPDGSRIASLKLENTHSIGWVDARTVDDRHLVAIQTNKGVPNNVGRPVIIDLAAGPEGSPDPKVQRGNAQDFAGVRLLKDVPTQGREGRFRDPYPLTPRWFLLCCELGVQLIDDQTGRRELLLAHEGRDRVIHKPQLLVSRPREPVLPDRPIPRREDGTPVPGVELTGRVMLQDFHLGREVTLRGIQRGDVASILVVENLPAPIRHWDPPLQLGFGSVWNLKRIIGTFPVEADGSAFAELPAMRSLQLIGLDKEGKGVRRMSSAFTLMPGETVGCVGCHEWRNDATPPAGQTLAMRRPPSQVRPDPGIPDIFDYARDIQPIWDRHCLECHNPNNPQGDISLSGDRNPGYPESLTNLVMLRHLDTVRARGPYSIPPRQAGAHSSPLFAMLDGSHHKAKPSPQEMLTLLRWLESGAQLPGTYAADGTGEVVFSIPRQTLQSCFDCHQQHVHGGRKINDVANYLIHPKKLNHGSGRLRDPLANLLLYNLSQPAMSRILKAPLAKDAGGWGLCHDGSGNPVTVFASPGDPVYKEVLGHIEAAASKLNAYEKPGFVPSVHYLREMTRYGILPEGYDPARDGFDPYEIDRRYFEQQYRTVYLETWE